jgi:chromate reductase
LLGSADAILLSTPEYAGSLPRSFKNLFDGRSEETASIVFPSGSINPWAHGGSQDTYAALPIVLDRAGADVIGAACKDIPVPRDAVDDDGVIGLPEIRAGASRVMIEDT